jgi:predicted ATPase
MPPVEGFLLTVTLLRERVADPMKYPFSIPAVRTLGRLELDPKVTFFIGENGTGKSTLVEAIAVAAGFNPEGGSKNFRFSTRSSESDLHRCLRVARSPRRPRTGFFLRAESLFNVATQIEKMDEEPARGPPVIASYGGKSLHEQSHGESFLTLVKHRFGPEGLYLLDEPEAALSPTRQLSLLSLIHDRIRSGSQFIIATHSPIILAYPGARIYQLSDEGLTRVAYEDTEHYSFTREFLLNREPFLRALLSSRDP